MTFSTLLFFISMSCRPPRSTLFPYTTLFRSLVASTNTNQILEFDGTNGALIGQFNHGGTATVLTLDQPWTSVRDRKSTRLNSSHLGISYAVFCLKKKTNRTTSSDTQTYQRYE